MSTPTWPPAEPAPSTEPVAAVVPAAPAAPPATALREPRWRTGIGRKVGAAAVAALALAGIVMGVAEAADTSEVTATTTVQDAASDDSSAQDSTLTSPSDSSGGTVTTPGGTYGWGGPGGASSGMTTSTQEDATAASDAESAGIVLIDTVLSYSQAEAAGTGLVLTSDGLILTNNHVIEGSTEITVTIATTGETYTATVVGTDADDDVALLQLEGASGLTTVTLDDDGDPTVGDDVTAVGNASGGGVLMAADGSVTELESSVTTASEYSVSGETLDGMIEFEADVVSGDSGGALLDDEGEVVGITTAASSGLATTIAYAIPIEDSLAIVDQIQAGDESDGVEIGYPAFLGIAIAPDSTYAVMPGGRPGSSATTASVEGAQVGYVYADTPAAAVGLAAGDVITAVDGTTVASGDDLAAALADHEPGDTVTLTWTDTSGETQTGDATLIAGPAA
ncbi:trypsin-like peptidase domain-containing protein [Demequina sp. SYSU T00039]|uniref:Trypsin-like peptidase domain-containing protein n=1 Tax=Demequina lignilytica TaxID=3051663 RepID=A0AAW7LZS5_9MICO|nr:MULTISPECIES: trypsin-like peptidase domain-containing protein [unclassified Demequina]MDN4478559.1 trypsin-like peptidase domain-containing protein [Demequina sp. SYSU T00039-1]MDN4486934.1 trypsin-like peptidase domain-containing protein [Demequina sp. SYSU T00039]